MRIIHVNVGFVQGGIDNMLAEIIQEQKSQGHEVILFILNNLINENVLLRLPKDVPVHFIRRPVGSYNPFYMVKLCFLIIKAKADIIHCHNSMLGKVLCLV